MMVFRRLFGLSKKAKGEVEIKDGKFKLETKEKWRLFGALTSAIMFTIMVAFFFLPAFFVLMVYLLGMVWIVASAFIWKLFDWIKSFIHKAWYVIKYSATWGIKQPIRDFRYGRKKRKELEDKQVYGE